MGSIYLIRHAQASFGAQDYDVLSPLGYRQAEALGDYLAQLGIRFDRCISGELHRQQDTARTTLSRLAHSDGSQPSLEIDAAFNEFQADAVIRAHLPELLEVEPNALHILRNAASHRAEFQRLFTFVVHRWISGEHEKEELESWSSFLERVAGGLERLLEQAEKSDKIAVFTSGGTITALLQRIIGVPAVKAFELNWQIVNTSLSQLKFRGREVALASFNSHAHLQLLKNPELVTHR
ncbi:MULTISPECIES: histidine phosphatase family protein [Pseudomonas]|jgi:broad specificity phosphatase PhoE|uniref:histidine phosphatase family protein n=1 Tax=Pseudomonas TaxID=286 RepID=UPI00028E638E|nr:MULTISPECIES: histidine phosphatase family protein [Pseudomonas]EKM96809.1 phosphoglycerate mutase family protein [Stutzerimonas degradans]MDT3710077.1 histidine phosphatase family protein [Pseudomonadaceae bacterium]KGK84934.1 phosphoglycerate mutase [Stutzerimonas degradans]MCQ4267675.1 phosphoglycerate mutase family protein [Stutzerimonas degradans]OOE09693.1 histidine phosphatase family protein [Stutzerimonas degradans]